MFFTEADRKDLMREVDARVRLQLTDQLKKIIHEQCTELVLSLFSVKTEVSLVKWGKHHALAESLQKTLRDASVDALMGKVYEVSREATKATINSEAFLDEIVTRILRKQVR